MHWRIYYDDDTTADSTQGLPQGERQQGVIAIIQPRADGRWHILSGGEYYLFDSISWMRVYQNGLEDWVMHKLHCIKCVCKGRSANQIVFDRIYKQAKADKDAMDQHQT